MRIAGSCHCGNISFTLNWEPEPKEIPARACACTFCTRHGGVWTSCPAGSLSVAVRDTASESRYAFGTRTAEFHVCATCGVVPVVTSRIKGTLYAVVNVNAFENIDRSLLKPTPATFDAESEERRLARRARNWIPNVTFTRIET